jgi:hypothetical protein
MLAQSLQIRARAELELRRRRSPVTLFLDDWEDWLKRLFPAYVTKPFAARHVDLWEWVERLQPGVKQPAFVAIWPRGGAKSSSAELACVRLGARKTRKYIWYISRTQDKADKHVETIAALLESTAIAREHPDLASRKVGKYGNSKGWRRSRLRTASGLTIDALGLDVGARGAKVEEQRPDLMIFDDVDEKHDTPATTQKIIETITTSLLPAGSSDCAVLFIQNKIHPNSIAAQLAEGKADFLTEREVSGPHPAVEGLTYEQRAGKFVITGGAATWEGQDLSTCQAQINTWGLSAFLQEAQHEVEQRGGIWDHIEFRHCRRAEVPDLVRGCVWCDPAVTSTDQSCANGIIADGLARDGTLYRLFAWENIDTPMNVLKRAIRIAVEHRLQYVGVETNQGGDLWRDEFNSALKAVQEEMTRQSDEERYSRIQWPGFRDAKAGTGTGNKVERNQRMLADYERGKVVHVEGTHTVLERALRRFPQEPLDLADAAYWGWADLAGGISWESLAGLGKVEGYTSRWK